jgi:hypothetical protein
MLDTKEIFHLAVDVANISEGDTETYWLKNNQSPKAIQEALKFLELDLEQPPERLFNFALALGYEMGKTDNSLQTYTSTN